MKIAVCMSSRERPMALIGVIMALHRLQSGNHTVEFHVGLDADDEKTKAAVNSVEPEPVITINYADRPIARGEIDNRLLLSVQPTNPDVVTLLTDRTFVISPGWDEALARGVSEQPKRLLWWSCPDDTVCVMPIIPKAWLDACDWKWSPEVFPFWFDDTWNQQIDLMIFGKPSLKLKAYYAGARGKTKRGRDFEFWLDVFKATFKARAVQAKYMAGKLGVEFIQRDDVTEYFAAHHNAMKAALPNIIAAYGDTSEPGPEYVIAKANAEKLLKEIPGWA